MRALLVIAGAVVVASTGSCVSFLDACGSCCLTSCIGDLPTGSSSGGQTSGGAGTSAAAESSPPPASASAVTAMAH
jgi:hypothetical protein